MIFNVSLILKIVTKLFNLFPQQNQPLILKLVQGGMLNDKKVKEKI